MTRSTPSRDPRRSVSLNLPPSAPAEMTLATARRLSAAYWQVFTIISESAIRLLTPAHVVTSDDEAQESNGASSVTWERAVESECRVCGGGRQENLRQRLRRVRAIGAPDPANEAHRDRVCVKLIEARAKALYRTLTDRRAVDLYLDELIRAFDEQSLDENPRRGAESLLLYDAPVARLRFETQRLRVVRATIHQERALLVNENRRLVMRVARRFMGRGLPFDDLVQEGSLALMRAIDKFDPDRGFRFSTYAMWWIRQGISRAIVDQSRAVRLPVHLSETLSRIRRTEARLTTRLGRRPELSEVARELELSEDKLRQVLQKVSFETSMQKPLGDSATEFGELLADESALQGYDVVEHNTLKHLLSAALDRLDSRSRYVLQAHHGLGGGRPLTLGDIGKVLGLSRERVRQIENEAFQRLRKTAREQHLEDFV